MIYFSLDQDWAPDWATRDIHDRLQTAGLHGTLFVTQDGPILAHARATGVLELGWHPNFLPGSSHGASVEEVLNTLAGWVPEARGARAHCLVRGTPFLQAYQARGLTYDAADLRDGEPDLAPFISWTGMVRIPIWFEDDVHLQRGKSCDLAGLALEASGLKVFTFHPVLVALNACDLNGYEALKADLSAQGVQLSEATRQDFAPHRQDHHAGLSDLLDDLIAYVQQDPNRGGAHLSDLAESALTQREG